jgi:mannosyl-glycoprotein endo-beta-N-acetylglucosaminidase
VYNSFIIHSEPLEIETINKGLAFFASKGWWASTATTNEKEYVYFKIVTEAYLEKETIKKAVSFFNSKNWWNTTQNTGKTAHTTFQIVTESLLGKEKANQALAFFTNNHWWAMSKPNGAIEQYYKIVTGSFGSLQNAEQKAQWLRDTHGWWVSTEKIK